MAKFRSIRFGCLCCIALGSAATLQAVEFDEVTREQAALERESLATGKSHSQSPGIAKFRQTAKTVRYPSGEYQLPGYLYLPEGAGPFAAIVWNHGSEKDPKAQPELARFYTQQGYVFFVPIRHGHAGAPGPYVGNLQDELRDKEHDPAQIKAKIVGLHELYNLDVVAAVEWLKQQPQVDSRRLVMSGVSYGGIQTLLSAEKGLGIRAFVPFAP
ncbi:MAG TPA: prolyl oligopeptidase family serine peptidase, partial [Pirellulales bacterium]|nr:prolyl oligopeptidase family serine peptidase [Pirellulales bacterium]